MELKRLNKIVILLVFAINIKAFSQMKMANIEGKDFLINSKIERRNVIPIFDDANNTIYYLSDKRNFDLRLGLGVNSVANLIFFSKKINKGILVKFEQMIYQVKKNIYEIHLRTGSNDEYMLIPSMLIVDKDFNYEYLMKYHYMMPPPPEERDYSSWITIEDIKNHCNFKDITLKGNIIYEDIDDILSNIPKISIIEDKSKKCNPLISNEDLNNLFPKKIIK